jgi:superfamily II DNA or RNA helicase
MPEASAVMTELRDYQQDAVDRFNSEPARCPLLVSPTGSGKTVVASAIMKQYADAYKNVLFIVHRREIIKQTSRKLRDLKIPHGIIMAGVKPRPLERVQVAAIQTLHARAIRSERMEMPPVDLLVIDEAHRAVARTYKTVIAAYPNARVLGLTATPCRGDGRGLGGIFNSIIELPQVHDLIEKGHLVRTRVYAPAGPDLQGVQVKMGDYVETQLANRMNTDRLVGNIVVHWHKYGERRKTVVFAVNVAHSVHIRDEFVKAGVRAEHIDGSTPKAERDETLERLARGKIEVIVNCMVLTEGWDMPEVGCCILARPTKQMGLYRQMIGRVLRPAPGKKDAIILDHSGAVFKHGFAEDHVEWTLDPEGKAKNHTQDARESSGGDRIVECSQCGSMREGGKPCFNCGFLPAKKPVEYQTAEGELGLVNQNRNVQKQVYDRETRKQWHAMLVHIAQERGYSPRWPNVQHKEKFGEWPGKPWDPLPAPIEPSHEVLSWVRSRNIAYAKSRAQA